MLAEWQNELIAEGSEEKRKVLERFFKTGKGEYGEGDRFIGVTVPANRAISKKYHKSSMEEILAMIESDIHEFRLAGLLALVERYKKAKGTDEKGKITDFYLEHCHKANNWDLVDLSAPYILGEELAKGRRREVSEQLLASGNLWRERVAIVSTLALIRKGDIETPLATASRLLGHPHDLIKKATGWVMRECGKKDSESLRRFMKENIGRIQAITMSYAIEKFDKAEQKQWREERKRAAERLNK